LFGDIFWRDAVEDGPCLCSDPRVEIRMGDVLRGRAGAPMVRAKATGFERGVNATYFNGLWNPFLQFGTWLLALGIWHLALRSVQLLEP
jgi:hypothetical protein